MITTINFNGIERVAILLHEGMTTADAEDYRSAILQTLESAACTNESMERLKASSLYNMLDLHNLLEKEVEL